MLTSDQVAEYHEKGYVVPDYGLSEETLESIRRDHDRLLAAHPDFRDNCPALLTYDLAFLNYARDPNILDMEDYTDYFWSQDGVSYGWGNNGHIKVIYP